MIIAKKTWKMAVVFSLFCVFTVTFGCDSSSLTAQFRKGPYLIYSNDNSKMTVMWQADMTPSFESKIEWGTTDTYSDGSAPVTESGSGSDEHLFLYAINGLSPSTYIYYRVTVDGTGTTGTFKTAPASDASSLTFYAYGDTRSDPRAHNLVVQRLMLDIDEDVSNRQTFSLHVGDFTLYGLTEAYWDEEFFDRDYLHTMDFLASIPLMAAMGNHEMYMAPPFDPNYESEHAGELLRKYWPNSLYVDSRGLYYSFDYGPLHVAVVDQYASDFDVSSAQYAWLEADLTASTKPWKTVLYHAPGWSASPADDTNARALTTRNDLGPLFVAQDLKFILQGHHHYYSRSDVNGITYLVLGGGGAPLEDPDPTYDYVVEAQKSYEFARFDIIDDNTMSVTVINADGLEIDSFTITQ